MHVAITEHSGVTVINIKGDIDINNSPEMKKFFDQVVREKRDKVLINLELVDYVDSSGLATLVEIYKKLRVYGGKLKLAKLSLKVKGLFEITKLNKLFDIVETESELYNFS
ncbi:Anti-sigma factor antagonist [Candidatus Omnitrophus magneticus]|uniref:Anti-sigma factor antagonist n=1 Tax=Candidatus Omnitrophus magneticus TaxID=1609969 RepID=A0A0F0CL98_9BACT|nr:Anti-sigma factor antagonist [Candidatus Omnitrophus magneticus]